MAVKTTAELAATHDEVVRVIRTIPDAALEWQPDAEPVTTTLRDRVIQMAASHLREHQTQMLETLARWQTTHKVGHGIDGPDSRHSSC